MKLEQYSIFLRSVSVTVYKTGGQCLLGSHLTTPANARYKHPREYGCLLARSARRVATLASHRPTGGVAVRGVPVRGVAVRGVAVRRGAMCSTLRLGRRRLSTEHGAVKRTHLQRKQTHNYSMLILYHSVSLPFHGLQKLHSIP